MRIRVHGMNIRISFEKYGNMAYLGHLDLMRFFQKALRRAGVPLKYSGGFHPHPIMSFAQPLSVGVTGGREIMDVSLSEDVDISVTKDAINSALWAGVYVNDIVVLPEKSKPAMSLVTEGEYLVFFRKSPDPDMSEQSLNASLEWLVSQKELIYEKVTKKGSRTEDIRPLILDIRLLNTDDISGKYPGLDLGESAVRYCFFMRLKTGSQGNLAPQVPISVLMGRMGAEPEDYSFGIHRIRIILAE